MPQKPRAEAIDELQALGEALILREICNEMIDFACPDPNSQTSGDDKDDDILSITDECDVSDSDSDRDTDDGLWSDAFESELSSVVELRRHLESRRYLAPRTKRTKGADVFATFAAQIDEAAFKQEYRVSCANFSRLVSQLETHPRMCRQSDTGAFRYPAAHRIAVGLKRLGSAAWLGNAARQHGVASGSVVGFTDDFVAAVLDRLHGVVSWPSAAERQGLREELSAKKGSLLSSLAIGFVDGSVIPLKNRPSTDERLYNESFYNFKGSGMG